ncbi:MAG: sulfatase-like hydrolase/transferase [Phycisphaerae bacterium]|nr:sulfatase-like hydrolase/transferase [Phycisphaerae bacterium]
MSKGPCRLASFIPFLIGATVLVVMAAAPCRAADGDRPNIVIILADDMGYGDASCYGGSSFQTPHIDRLADEGMRFTDFHSNGAVCSPTRAALLTGRYQQRSGIAGVVFADPKRNRHHGLQAEAENTFAELLKTAGYATGAFGKWHVGYEKQYNPVHHGFDVFRGYVSGNVDFANHLDGMGIFDWWHNLELDRDDRGYTTHLITKHALAFIEQHRDRPFCLYLPHEAPHYPYQGPNDPPLRKEGVPGQAGGLWNDREPKHMKRAYIEMMTELDRSVGAVVHKLRELKLERRTFVFFFSDNGATGPGSCGGLRGRKGSLWEGGHRVPAVAWWPGRIKRRSTSAELCMGMDLMPTMLDLAGVSAPRERSLDGVSLLPVMLQGAKLGPRKVFWEHGNQQAMRHGKWKLVRGIKGVKGAGLFDLEADRAEQGNLATEQADRVRQMLGELEAWKADVSRGATPQPQKPQAKE